MQYTDKPLLNVTLKTKEKILLEGYYYSFSSVNENGIFDILPYHANFITLIKDKVILDSTLPSEKVIPIDKGIVYTLANKVEVYIGI